MRISGMVLIASIALAACSSDGSNTTPSIAGTFRATTFQYTRTGGSPVDVLAAGGSLTITISASGASSGTLDIPESLDGGSTGSMAGTATVRNGTDVNFTQSADTFVRDLTWTLSTASLSVTSQVIVGTSFTIVLARQ